MEVGENRVRVFYGTEKRVRRRETRDIYRRHQPRLQPAVSDPCTYATPAARLITRHREILCSCVATNTLGSRLQETGAYL